MTFVAMNLADFAGGTSCGSCIWFRGTGEAALQLRAASCATLLVSNVGVFPISPTALYGQMILVDPITAGGGIGVESRKISEDWQV